MGKKRTKGIPKKNRSAQQQSMKNQMSDLVLDKVRSYIDNQINQILGAVVPKHLNAVVTRIVAIEKALNDSMSVDVITNEYLAERAADVEDERDGMDLVSDSAKEGDRVRLDISTKSKEQEAYQGSTKLLIDNLGSGRTLGKEIEDAVLGMKRDAEKEIEFGEDKGMLAKIQVNRVSRRPEPTVNENEESNKEQVKDEETNTSK